MSKQGFPIEQYTFLPDEPDQQINVHVIDIEEYPKRTDRIRADVTEIEADPDSATVFGIIEFMEQRAVVVRVGDGSWRLAKLWSEDDQTFRKGAWG